jgi:hypothetical protein
MIYCALEWPEPYSGERATAPQHPSVHVAAGPRWTVRPGRGPPPVYPVHGILFLETVHYFNLIRRCYKKVPRLLGNQPMVQNFIASACMEVGRDCHGFYCGFAEKSVGIQFHFGDCGSTDQGIPLYTCQDHLLWTTTSIVVYIKDSLSARSAEEDCV